MARYSKRRGSSRSRKSYRVQRRTGRSFSGKRGNRSSVRGGRQQTVRIVLEQAGPRADAGLREQLLGLKETGKPKRAQF